MGSQAVDFMLQQIFHSEVEHQCKFALMAYEDLKQALAVIQQPPPALPAPPTRPAVNFTGPAQLDAFCDQWNKAMAERRRISSKYLEAQTAAEHRLWFSVQAFLVAAGNVSKLLWPAPYDTRRLPERGPEFRASLEVEEDSPLESRTLRNRFEHFGARLEKWAVSSQHRIFIDSNIGPAGGISGGEPGDYLRNFDPGNFAVTFHGDTYPLPTIADALEQLWHKATVRLQHPMEVRP
jgi:hypothetical protein